ncbi:MAG: T9SS type A sorting domain-containing protein [Bacteroidia bacterium]|nr:MAG: T9SS type A sorting domain-containing protein [Bacteroidia bacterium]
MVKGSFNPATLKFGIITLILFLINSFHSINCQEKTYTFFYRVYLKDKGANDIGDFLPLDLLSEKAVQRREKADIPVPEIRDIPVWSGYIDQIASLGFKLHCTSRWMNTALFKTEVMADLSNLTDLPFVSNVKIVRNAGRKNQTEDKLSFKIIQDDLPPFNMPLMMLNGVQVHNSGLTGKGVLIAVLDGGFLNTDNISSLNGLRSRNGIKGTFDFVENKEFVYGFHNHGTAVMSVLAGYIPETLEGTAPGADYWLLRSEDTGSEFPVEEDYWIAAAEFADSLGADIISSSLGYCTFDDPLLDYKFSDMDGKSAFITRAADIAASKGILVVNSAGNERNKTWIHIIAPSDGDSVLAVGAVDGHETISAFSSAGPSYDRRIKPDVVSQGVSIPVQILASEVGRASGTSFSCPIISGMCACIMQAVPKAVNSEIIYSLRSASDRFLRPDSLYGYGIPDIEEIISQLQGKYILKPGDASVASPNPFNNELKITFREIPEKLRFEIYDLTGKVVMIRNYKDFVSRMLIIDDLPDLKKGYYFIRLITPGGNYTHKVIKVNNPL